MGFIYFLTIIMRVQLEKQIHRKQTMPITNLYHKKPYKFYYLEV